MKHKAEIEKIRFETDEKIRFETALAELQEKYNIADHEREKEKITLQGSIGPLIQTALPTPQSAPK